VTHKQIVVFNNLEVYLFEIFLPTQNQFALGTLAKPLLFESSFNSFHFALKYFRRTSKMLNEYIKFEDTILINKLFYLTQ